MAAKKKSTSAAPRSGKASTTAPAASVPTAEVSAASVPAVTVPAAVEAPVKAAVVPVATASMAPMATAPVEAVAESASGLPGLEVDVRPTIQMPAPPARAEVPHEHIARRAHEIHLARGGTAFDNWLQAERELAGR